MRRVLEKPQVVPDSHRAKTHVEVGKSDPEKAEPGPEHVAAVEAAHAAISGGARRRAGKLIAKSANQMPQCVAAKGKSSQQNHVYCEKDGADSDPERRFPGRW